jgi:hypothetical protein
MYWVLKDLNKRMNNINRDKTKDSSFAGGFNSSKAKQGGYAAPIQKIDPVKD